MAIIIAKTALMANNSGAQYEPMMKNDKTRSGSHWDLQNYKNYKKLIKNSLTLKLNKNVIKLPTLELYNSIINTIKESTQVYYNMRLALGLECA